MIQGNIEVTITNGYYIRAVRKTTKGETVYSGQRIRSEGGKEYDVVFEPNHGFRFGGANFADAYPETILKNIKWYQKVWGGLRFAWYNIFGV